MDPAFHYNRGVAAAENFSALPPVLSTLFPAVTTRSWRIWRPPSRTPQGNLFVVNLIRLVKLSENLCGIDFLAGANREILERKRPLVA
jgi:hypothetical protein